jgi:hypothetical protein
VNAEVPAMQPPAAAGENLAAPRIEGNLVRVPDGQQVPQQIPEATVPLPAARPWYRRRRPLIAVIAAVAVLLGGLAAGLVLTVFASSSPADPASVLQADGYPLEMSLTPAQMAQMGAFSNSAGAAAKPYIGHMVIGEKGKYAEMVVSLTPAGEAKARANLGDFGSSIMGIGGAGVTWHMTSGDLVVNMPSSVLNGTGAQGT